MPNDSQTILLATPTQESPSSEDSTHAPSSVSKTFSPETLELAELLAPFSPHVPLADIQRLVGYLESDRTVEMFRQLDGRFNLEKFSQVLARACSRGCR